MCIRDSDKGEHIQYTYADLKKYTDMTASYFQSLGIGPVSYTHISQMEQMVKISDIDVKACLPSRTYR